MDFIFPPEQIDHVYNLTEAKNIINNLIQA